MKAIAKLVKKLSYDKYKTIFGFDIRVNIDLSDGFTQICLGKEADYISIAEAIQTLKSMTKVLEKLEKEIKMYKREIK